MKQFTTIEKLDTAILYLLELASSVSVLLLAFGLIASMANVLTKGSVLTDHAWMQQIWAWTQCIAIDASVAGTIIRTFRYQQEGEHVKMWLYGLLSVLLLFTAAIVSNIEAIQQTLNLTLNAAYIHVFVPVEALIWIRSIAIVLLIVAHAMRHVQLTKADEPVTPQAQTPLRVEITPDLIDALCQALPNVQVVEETPETRQLVQRVPIKEVQLLESEVQVLSRLLPGVSVQDITAVIKAFGNGTQRRDICAQLHWGASKYTTIVKPVLDQYEKLQQTA